LPGAGGRDDYGGAAVRDGRVHERHVGLIAWAQLVTGQRLGVLGRGHALPGQRRLVDLQDAGLDDPAIGRDLIPGGNEHHVADDQFLGGDFRLRPIPPHPGGRLHHRFEGVHGAFGLALLPHADHRVQHRQQHQQDRGAPLLDQQGHDRGGDQDDLHVAAVLAEEPEPARLGFLLRQRIRAVRAQQFRRPRVRQPHGRIDPELSGNLIGRPRVPAIACPG